jgi:phosphomannomutase
MRSLRAEPLERLGSEPVTVRHDFLVDGTGGATLTPGEQAARNVLELISEHYRIVVRPSGTEAKLKHYFDYTERPQAGPAADRFGALESAVSADCAAVYADLARRAGYELSQAALKLPDVMPVQEKAGYQPG